MPEFIESLEQRVLLSLTVKIALHDGVLTVNSTRARNLIRFGIDESNVHIVMDEGTDQQQWLRTDIRRIVINGGRRADDIECNFGTPVPITINAGGGDDYLSGGSAADHINGGPGNDVFADNWGADVLQGGPGMDEARFFNRGADLTITLDGRANDGQDLGGKSESMNVGSDIEKVTGGQGNDLIVGNAANNVLDGYLGDDTLMGGAGDDTLIGNLGSDRLLGERGNDTLVGRRDHQRDRLNGGPGIDVASGESFDIRTKIESFQLSD